jgi:hypothetical protein
MLMNARSMQSNGSVVRRLWENPTFRDLHRKGFSKSIEGSAFLGKYFPERQLQEMHSQVFPSDRVFTQPLRKAAVGAKCSEGPLPGLTAKMYMPLHRSVWARALSGHACPTVRRRLGAQTTLFNLSECLRWSWRRQSIYVRLLGSRGGPEPAQESIRPAFLQRRQNCCTIWLIETGAKPSRRAS